MAGSYYNQKPTVQCSLRANASHHQGLIEDNLSLQSTAIQLVKSVLASVSYASHTTVHCTLGISPSTLVFGRDMLLPTPIIHYFNLIREGRQMLIDSNSATQNHRRNFKDYTTVGREVIIWVPNPAGLDPRDSLMNLVEG
jgi:hypothetical protein